MRRACLTIYLAISLGAACSAAPTPGAQTTAARTRVTVRATADVPGRTFTLGEIAEIDGPDKAVVAQIGAVEVGTSPLPGLTRTVTLLDVLSRLRFNHIDPRTLDVTFPPNVRIARGGAEVPAADVVKAATDALQVARKGIDDGATLEPAPILTKLYVAPGKCEIQAGAPRGQVTGTTAIVPVTIMVDGKPAKNLDVTFRIRRMYSVVVAKRVLAPHTVLMADDVTMGSIEVSPGAQTPLADLDAVIGKRTTRSLNAGAAITATAIESAPVVVTGASVTVEINVGGVRISAPAVARSSGAVGETVRVFATDTKKELAGVVVDSKTVRVEEKG